MMKVRHMRIVYPRAYLAGEGNRDALERGRGVHNALR